MTDDSDLFSKGWLFAALLDMVEHHCGTGGDRLLKSFGWKANARALRLLAEAGYVEIADQSGDAIEARVTSEGRVLLERVAGRQIRQQRPKSAA